MTEAEAFAADAASIGNESEDRGAQPSGPSEI